MILLPSKIRRIYIHSYFRRLTPLKKILGVLILMACVFIGFLLFNLSKTASRQIFFLEVFFIIVSLTTFAGSIALALNTLFKKTDADVVASPRFQLIPSQSMLEAQLFGLAMSIFVTLPIVIAFHPSKQAFGYTCLAALTTLFVAVSVVLVTYILLFFTSILIRKIHAKVSKKLLWKYLGAIFIAITVISVLAIISSYNLSSAKMIQAYSILPSSIPAIATYAEETRQLFILLSVAGIMLIISLALLAIFDFSSGWFLEAWQDIYETQDNSEVPVDSKHKSSIKMG